VSKLLTVLLLSSAPVWGQSRAQCDGLLNRYLRLYPAVSWEYDWTTAIFLYGALKYQKKELDLSSLAAKAPAITMPDLAAMSLPASLLTGPAAEKIQRLSREFFKTEPLNSIGAINHVGQRHWYSWFVPESVWADSMMMYVLNGLRLKIDDEFFIKQAKLLVRTLQDPQTKLFKHAYFPQSQSFYPAEHFWARGNLWMTVGMLEMLELHHDAELQAMVVEHLKALERYTHPAGLMTLLDTPSQFESSATALLAYALIKAKTLRLYESPLIAQVQSAAFSFLRPAPNNEFTLTEISGPTTAFKYGWYYTNVVGQHSDLSYGVGSFLLLCSSLQL